MKNLLIISFDFVKTDDPEISLNIGALLASLKKSPYYNKKFISNHINFSLFQEYKVDDIIKAVNEKYNISTVDYIAISVFIWSEFLINPIITHLRKMGYKNKIILGGAQVKGETTLKLRYPGADFFIIGYGEKSLMEILLDENSKLPPIIKHHPNYKNLPSPYLTGIIPLHYEQKKIRIETKRGCPYNCSYCMHKHFSNSHYYELAQERIFDELALFKEKRIRRINIIDPTFNIGSQYLKILEKCNQLRLESEITLQTRYEKLFDRQGQLFLEYCHSLNVILEIGLQSLNNNELKVLNRPPINGKIDNLFKQMKRMKIPFEVSILFGIPEQTIQSFYKSINFLLENNCETIKIYPLQLYPGTELKRRKIEWKLQEENLGIWKIPYVISSSTFNKFEWEKMLLYAKSVASNKIEI